MDHQSNFAQHQQTQQSNAHNNIVGLLSNPTISTDTTIKSITATSHQQQLLYLDYLLMFACMHHHWMASIVYHMTAESWDGPSIQLCSASTDTTIKCIHVLYFDLHEKILTNANKISGGSKPTSKLVTVTNKIRRGLETQANTLTAANK